MARVLRHPWLVLTGLAIQFLAFLIGFVILYTCTSGGISLAQSLGNCILELPRSLTFHVVRYGFSAHHFCSYRDADSAGVWVELEKSQIPLSAGFRRMGRILDLPRLYDLCAPPD